MSARLVIHLPEAAEDVFAWALMSAAGEVLAEGEGSQSPDLPATADISATIALIPAHLAQMRTLSIPARSEKAAREAAPFAIEEYLAASPDTQRIVCSEPLGDGQRRVMAVEAGLADRWQALLERCATRPVFAVSDAMLLEPDTGELAVAFYRGRAVWRYRDLEEDVSGGCPDSFSDLVLPALAAAHNPQRVNLSGAGAETLQAFADYPVREWEPADFNFLASQVSLAGLKAQPALFGAGLMAVMDWQGVLGRWRLAAGLALTAGALALASVASEAVWLSTMAQRLETQSREAFTAAFPDIRRVVNPRVQLAQRLREIEAVDGGSDQFLSLSAALAGVLENAPSVEILAVRFEAGSAALSVSARYGDFSDFEALRAAGEAAGLVIEDAGARQGADGVNADFVVRWGA